MVVSAVSVVGRSGADRSVRDLLDAARAQEGSDLDTARTLIQQARLLARSQGDASGEAESLYRLAGAAHAGARDDEAFSLALEARELARACGATVVEVWALNLIGIVHYSAGNYSEALAHSLQALDLYRTTDHKIDEGNLLNTVAVIHHSLGDTDRAIVTYEGALAANKGMGRPENDAVTLSNMAQVRADRHENLLAVSLGEQALELSREHAPLFVPDILARLGDAYASLAHSARAQACLREAIALLDERSDAAPATIVAVRLASGRLSMQIGDHDAAQRDLELALELALRTTNPEGVLRAHTALAEMHKGLGRFEQALVHQEARFTANEELFNRGADLRIKTLQIAHDTEAARQQAEILRLRTSELEALVRGRTRELEEYQLETFQRLAVLAEFRDPDTNAHTVGVGDLAADVALALGQPPEWADELRLAARLHDIGKVSVPDEILLKPGPLSVEEFEVMKTHPGIGAQILSGSTSSLVQLAAEIALTHHERWDGAGYPNQLAREEIPLSGRIVAVADVYEALTSQRTYKDRWPPRDAARYVIAASGTQFEPSAVTALLAVVADREPDVAALLADNA